MSTTPPFVDFILCGHRLGKPLPLIAMRMGINLGDHILFTSLWGLTTWRHTLWTFQFGFGGTGNMGYKKLCGPAKNTARTPYGKDVLRKQYPRRDYLSRDHTCFKHGAEDVVWNVPSLLTALLHIA